MTRGKVFDARIPKTMHGCTSKTRVDCEALARGGRGRGRFCNNLMAIYRCREKLERLSLSLLVRRQAVWDQGTCRDGKGRKSLHHTSAHSTALVCGPTFFPTTKARGRYKMIARYTDKIQLKCDPSHVKEMLRVQAWKRVLASCSMLLSRGISHKIDNKSIT